MTDLDAFARKWEQAVHRQESKGLKQLTKEIKDDSAELQALVARGIRRICIIGKKLEAVKRLAGHGKAIEAWAKLGYSQPQANKYIQASKFEPLLRELQSQRDDPLGIAQAYETAVRARKVLESDAVTFEDLEDPETIKELAEAVAMPPKPSKKKAQNEVDRVRNSVARVIGDLELLMHNNEARALIAQLHDWSGKVLEEDDA